MRDDLCVQFIKEKSTARRSESVPSYMTTSAYQLVDVRNPLESIIIPLYVALVRPEDEVGRAVPVSRPNINVCDWAV
jgi:hypothetical protein